MKSILFQNLSNFQIFFVNFISSFLSQIILFLLNFSLRSVFIYTFGLNILGLNTFLLSTFGLISFFELGISEIISYFIYKSRNSLNKDGILYYTKLFQKFNNYIIKIYFFISFAIIIFIYFFVPDYIDYTIIFIVFSLVSITNLFFKHNRILLISDQKKYIENLIHTLSSFIFIGFQFFSIIILNSYLIYVLISLTWVITEGLILNKFVIEHYRFKNFSFKPTKEEKSKFWALSKAAAIQHFSGTVSLNVDNIILNIYYGLNIVGLISNFSYIVNYIYKFIVILFDSIQPTIGGIVNSNSPNKFKYFSFFDKFVFLFFYYSSIILVFFLNDFISLWLGNNYLIDQSILFILSYGFLLNGMRQSLTPFINSFGLQDKLKYRFLYHTLINISLSLIFINLFSVFGLYLATLFATIITNTFAEPFLLFKYGFRFKSREYILFQIFKVLIFPLSYIFGTEINIFLNFTERIVYYCIFGFILFTSFLVFSRLLISKKRYN